MARKKGNEDAGRGLVAINAEMTALEGKTDEASEQRWRELLDDLINMDMGMGPARRAMCQGGKPKPRAEEGGQP